MRWCTWIIKHSLVGGWTNPFEKYESNWIISPSRCENKKCLKPPTTCSSPFFGGTQEKTLRRNVPRETKILGLATAPGQYYRNSYHWWLCYYWGYTLKTQKWNLKIHQIKRKSIFQTSIVRFHVNFPGCNYSWCIFFQTYYRNIIKMNQLSQSWSGKQKLNPWNHHLDALHIDAQYICISCIYWWREKQLHHL